MVRRNLAKVFAACVIVLVVIAVLPVTVSAQERKIELTPTISYMWAGSYTTIDGDISLKDGTQYGGIIGFPVAPQVRLEFFYATLSSRATFVPYYVGKPSTLDGLDMSVNIHYFQLGGVHYIDKGKVQPFIGIAAGAVLFHPKEDRYQGYTLEDSWRFAMSAIGGLTISVSDVVGLRLQGRLLLPMYFSGGGIWVGTGGASVGASAGIPIVQGDVGAGITIRF